MSGETVTLRRADESDLLYVESLLAANDLPTEDVATNADCFYVGEAHGEPVGVGGVEVYGRHGLLRSVVVEADARNAGFGSAVCDALEREAREDGVERLFLLTTTAADFFADRGYDEIARSAAPDAIRETTEFAELCPDSATVMRKSL